MAGKKELLEEMSEELGDFDDENKRLIEFFDTNLPLLMKCRVTNAHYSLIRSIAVWIDETKESEHDWLAYATEMGITDNEDLARIKVSDNKQPIFHAMFYKLRHNCGSFGHIVKSLLKNKRYDVLGKIESKFEEILKMEISSQTTVKRMVSVHMEAPVSIPEAQQKLANSTELPKEEATAPIFSPNNKGGSHPDECCTVNLNCAPVKDDIKCEFDSFQEHSINIFSGNAQQISHHPNSSQPASEGNESPSSQKEKIPSAPVEDTISVFIQHTEHEQDIAIAKELSEILRKEGMTVNTLSDLELLFQMDASGSLLTFFLEADFIVPIVSNHLLQQLYPQNLDPYLESAYAQNNRNLHQLIMTEYRNNRCVNFRVRPVIVPEMNRRQLVKDVIFSFSLRLWKEVPKLVKILKETKKLNAERLVH